MVLDILSIPAILADPKRLFSSAKLLISDLRNKLGMDIIKAFEYLKSWYKIVTCYALATHRPIAISPPLGHHHSLIYTLIYTYLSPQPLQALTKIKG